MSTKRKAAKLKRGGLPFDTKALLTAINRATDEAAKANKKVAVAWEKKWRKKKPPKESAQVKRVRKELNKGSFGCYHKHVVAMFGSEGTRLGLPQNTAIGVDGRHVEALVVDKGCEESATVKGGCR